jgi:hypothetical protein
MILTIDNKELNGNSTVIKTKGKSGNITVFIPEDSTVTIETLPTKKAKKAIDSKITKANRLAKQNEQKKEFLELMFDVDLSGYDTAQIQHMINNTIKGAIQ